MVTLISSAPGDGVESIMSAAGDSDDMVMCFSTEPYVLLFPTTCESGYFDSDASGGRWKAFSECKSPRGRVKGWIKVV